MIWGILLKVVILAVCCTFSTVASEHPCAHEEGSAHWQPLCSSDRPGTWHQVFFPHVGHQPHPLLQLPSWSHAGERGAVRGGVQTRYDGQRGAASMLCEENDGLSGLRHVICVTHFCSDTFRVERQTFTLFELSTVIVGLSPFLFTQVNVRVSHTQRSDRFAKS